MEVGGRGQGPIYLRLLCWLPPPLVSMLALRGNPGDLVPNLDPRSLVSSHPNHICSFSETPHSLTVTGQSPYRTHAWVEVVAEQSTNEGAYPRGPGAWASKLRALCGRALCGAHCAGANCAGANRVPTKTAKRAVAPWVAHGGWTPTLIW